MSTNEQIQAVDLILKLWPYFLGTGTITGLISWYAGGRQAKKIELKKGTAGALESMQTVYDKFLEDYKNRMSDALLEVVSLKGDLKGLQKQFNEIHLAYAKEVEKSDNWQRLYMELKDKHSVLEREHEDLKKDFDKLKKDFDQHKKQATK